MKGISQTYETVTVPYSGVLNASAHFKLNKGNVFTVENGLGYYPNPAKGLHFILAQPFDSEVDKVMVGYLSGKVVPAQVTDAVTEGDDLMTNSNGVLVPHVAGSPILAHVVQKQSQGLALVQTTFINTEEE